MIQRRNYILVTVFFWSFQLYKIRKLNDSPLQNAFFGGKRSTGTGTISLNCVYLSYLGGFEEKNLLLMIKILNGNICFTKFFKNQKITF